MSSDGNKSAKRSSKKRRRSATEQEIDKLDSLPWTSSVPIVENPEDDSIPLLIGSNELEGGFFGLEEIDEADYGFGIESIDFKVGKKKLKGKAKSKKGEISKGDISEKSVDDVKVGKKKLKRKAKSKKGDLSEGDVSEKSVEDPEKEDTDEEEEKKEVKQKKKTTKKKKIGLTKNEDTNIEKEDTVEENEDEEKKEVKQKKKKKTTKKKKMGLTKNDETSITDRIAESEDGVSEKDNSDIDEDPVDEDEYSAWNELRLHPIIMKSIYRLKFKEPTPVQKACIPAAAHEGKDIIGAAETGSGKTLAFGLPILQRLLDEQEKMERIMGEKGDINEDIAPRNVMRALIITPTRELALQVADHIEVVTKGTNVRVVRIVGGLSKEKHERQLKARPEIVVGTPGRLWELMSGGETHLVELNYLSFFVLDEADRMIETGHFRELQSIIDMLPKESSENQTKNTSNCVTVVGHQLKKRQTFVFSATLSLSGEFRKKMKRGSSTSKKDDFDSLETLSERAGMRANKKIVDLTNPSILAEKIVQSVIECNEDEKDAYLYYILCVHGQGQTIVFCSSIAALRHISAFLSSLSIKVSTLHSEMQQRARLKSMDQFRANKHGVLVATDAAARGLDIPGVRTVVHYQLPHSRDVYVHRCGRTARASTDGCSIALISSKDAGSYVQICKSFSKGTGNEGFPRFPVETSYMPEIRERSSLAHQIDKIVRKLSKENAEKTWLERNAKSVGLDLEDDDSEEETVKKHKHRKSTKSQLENLKQELKAKLSRPLQQKTLSRRFFAGAGVSPLFQNQLEELGKEKLGNGSGVGPNKKQKLMVIGQERVEPLEALRKAGQEGVVDLDKIAQNRKNADNLKRKRKEMKKRLHEQRRKHRKQLKQGGKDNK